MQVVVPRRFKPPRHSPFWLRCSMRRRSSAVAQSSDLVLHDFRFLRFFKSYADDAGEVYGILVKRSHYSAQREEI